MVERSKRFPHIQKAKTGRILRPIYCRLKLTKEGIAAPASSGPRRQNARITANASDRWGHGSSLKSSLDYLISYWQN